MVRILLATLLALPLLGPASARAQQESAEPSPGQKQAVSKPPADSDRKAEKKQEYSSKQVTFQVPMRDGGAEHLQIRGTLYRPGVLRKPKVPGVLLLHMLGSDRTSWQPLIPDIVGAGYAVLAIDFRGHGESGGPAGRRHGDFTERDWQGLAVDARKAQQFLAEREFVNGERIGVIGASIGANIALKRATASEHVRTAILLSPGLDYRGVTTSRGATAYPEKSLFIMASEGDEYAARSARRLSELAANPHPKKLKLFAGKAHGTELFQQETRLSGLILNWLYNHLLF